MARDGGVHQEKRTDERPGLGARPNLLREMATAAHGKMRAGRMGDHQVPLLIGLLGGCCRCRCGSPSHSSRSGTRHRGRACESIACAGAVFTSRENLIRSRADRQAQRSREGGALAAGCQIRALVAGLDLRFPSFAIVIDEIGRVVPAVAPFPPASALASPMGVRALGGEVIDSSLQGKKA